MSFSARYLRTVLLTTLSLPTLLPSGLRPVCDRNKPLKFPQFSLGPSNDQGKRRWWCGGGTAQKRFQMPFEPFQKATTDQDGFYRITNVAAGKLRSLPTVPAFVPADRKDARAKTFLLAKMKTLKASISPSSVAA